MNISVVLWEGTVILASCSLFQPLYLFCAYLPPLSPLTALFIHPAVSLCLPSDLTYSCSPFLLRPPLHTSSPLPSPWHAWTYSFHWHFLLAREGYHARLIAPFLFCSFKAVSSVRIVLHARTCAHTPKCTCRHLTLLLWLLGFVKCNVQQERATNGRWGCVIFRMTRQVCVLARGRGHVRAIFFLYYTHSCLYTHTRNWSWHVGQTSRRDQSGPRAEHKDQVMPLFSAAISTLASPLH